MILLLGSVLNMTGSVKTGLIANDIVHENYPISHSVLRLQWSVFAGLLFCSTMAIHMSGRGSKW